MNEVTNRFINAIERLILDGKDKSERQIVLKLGMRQAQLSDAKRGSINVPKKYIDALQKEYFVNSTYIHTGEGDFYLPDNSDTEVEPTIRYAEKRGLPFYGIDFQTGVQLVISKQIQPSFYIDYLAFNDCDFYVNNNSSAMLPTVAIGDKIALKKVSNWKDNLKSGLIYGVITNNDENYLCRVKTGSNSDFVLMFDNSAEQPIELNTSDIRAVYRVKGGIKEYV